MKTKAALLAAIGWALITASIGSANEKSCDELLQDSERLLMEHKDRESDQVLDKVMEICPNLAELYWRKARNIYVRLESVPRDQKPDKETLVEFYVEIEALADRCIELDENDGSCWLWKGIALGRRATTEGVLSSFWIGDRVEKAWLRAIELKPTYRMENGLDNALGNCYHALGMYYRTVPEWLCYFPLKQIVGTCGDKQKSIEYQRKAVALEPKRIEYLRGLAVSLLCHGQTYEKPEEIEEAKKIMKEILALPEGKPSEKIDKEHVKMLLGEPSLACGYQRDAQQETDREAYDKIN
jgi:tetratricopeptide (TPR) repeat protein